MTRKKILLKNSPHTLLLSLRNASYGQGVEFWVVNTDAQALVNAQTVNVCQIGEQVTRGLGCGGNPELGEVAANESRDKLNEIVKGSDLVLSLIHI